MATWEYNVTSHIIKELNKCQETPEARKLFSCDDEGITRSRWLFSLCGCRECFMSREGNKFYWNRSREMYYIGRECDREDISIYR